MQQKEQITLAIVTKDRVEKLTRLLNSLVKQRLKPVQIIIVDNDKYLSAFKVAKNYSRLLPIRYLVEPRQGVPYARNRALSYVSTEYLAFIDDDCVVARNWFLNATRIVNSFPKFTYFIGSSGLLNQDSSVALAQYIHQRYWFEQKLVDQVIASPFNLDTKNVIFKLSDLKKLGLSFDLGMSCGWFDSADTDLGFLLESKGLLGLYLDKLKVWHEETRSLTYFIKKAYYRGKLARRLANKWDIKGEFVYLPFLNWITYIKSIKDWPREYQGYFTSLKRKNLIAFLFIKLYERIFLKGYTKE